MSKPRAIYVFPADFLMVFAGLFGAVFSFVTSFAIPVDTPVLALGTLGIALFFTALFSLKKGLWRVLCLLTLGGGFGLTVSWMWDKVTLGAEGIAHQVWTVFASGFPFLQGPQALEIPEELLLPAVTLFFLLLSALLGCYLAWGLVRVRVFWPAALVTMLFLLPALTLTLVPDTLPLTVLMAFYAMGLLSRLIGREDRRGGARLTYTVLPLTLALLLILRLAVPEEGYRRSDWIEAKRSDMTDWAVRVGQSLMTGNLGAFPNLFTSQPDAQVNLAAAGPLHYTGRTVLRVDSTFTGHIYLRGYSAGAYTGDGWEPLPEELYSTYLPDLDGGTGEGDWETVMGYQPMNFPALADAASYSKREPVRMEVENVAADPGYVYVPYHLETPPDRMSGATFHQDSYLARGAGIWNYVLYIRQEASPMDGSMLTGEAAWVEERYRALVNDAYTALPEDYDTAALLAQFEQWQRQLPGVIYDGDTPSQGELLTQREYEIAYGGAPAELEDADGYEVTTQAGNPVRLSGYSAAAPGSLSNGRSYRQYLVGQVKEYLASRCRYDPQTPYTPEEEDFVDYFLEESGRGYCMHFASAATVLLRAMGVPARYTAGYVADVQAGKTAQVPDYNAHAWVEVYFDGYGWQPVEVTPSFSGTFPWTEQEAEPTPSPTPTPPPAATPRPSAAPQATPTPDSQGGQEGAAERMDLRWLWIPAAVLAVLAAVWLRRRIILRKREKRFRDADVNAAVIQAYRYLERVLRWSGAEMDPVLLELAQKAKFSRHTLTEDEREHFLLGVRAAARETREQLPWYKKLIYKFVWIL